MNQAFKAKLTDTVTKNVKHIRKELNLTIAELAGDIEVNPKNLSAMEEGRSLSIETIYKLAQFINVTVDTVLFTDMQKGYTDEL